MPYKNIKEVEMELNKIYCGDALTLLQQMPDESVDCCITSPPYWGLRDYGTLGQFGLEATPEEYVAKLVEVFREVRRVLKKEGTLWLNIGDSYAGSGCGTNDYRTEASRSINKSDVMFCKSPPQQRLGRQGKTSVVSEVERGRGYYHSGFLKPKDIVGVPWRVAFALQADGWWLRQDIIWSKPNPMPESVTDRCTKAHEYVFLLTKSPKYYFDAEAIKHETMGSEHDKRARVGRKRFPTDMINGIRNTGYYPKANKRSVWIVNTKPFKEAHFAVFPEELIEPMILAGCPKNKVVLDPFLGSGTTALVALKLNRQFIGIELKQEYVNMAQERIKPYLEQSKLVSPIICDKIKHKTKTPIFIFPKISPLSII